MLQFAYPIYIEEMHFYRTAWMCKRTVFPQYFKGVFGIFCSSFWARIRGIFCPLSALFCAKRILGRYWAKNAQKRHQELT